MKNKIRSLMIMMSISTVVNENKINKDDDYPNGSK
jgi:hypothetical protein